MGELTSGVLEIREPCRVRAPGAAVRDEEEARLEFGEVFGGAVVEAERPVLRDAADLFEVGERVDVVVRVPRRPRHHRAQCDDERRECDERGAIEER